MIRRLLIGAIAVLPFLHGIAQAQQARLYQPAELEALLAPVALYPDFVLANILAAATHPGDVIEAARQPQAANPYWDPSVQALLSYPELLQNMASSPAWMFDLGTAYLGQAGEMMRVVQVLRYRAQASGALPAQQAQQIQQYATYYDPLVVYGAWQPVYRVVYWRPWVAHRPAPRVFVSNHFRPNRNGPPSPAAQLQAQNYLQRQQQLQQQNIRVTPYGRVPESSRRPIVQSNTAPVVPAASRQLQQHRAHVHARTEPHHQQRRHSGS